MIFNLMAFMLLLLIPLGAFALQETGGENDLDPAQLIIALNAVIVWLAVKVVNLIKKAAPVWLLGLLVPIFSALGAWIVKLIDPGSGFLITFLVGFAATFINELIKYLTTSKK